MAEKVIVFRGSTGLNNKIDPARLKFDPETGVQDLAEAVNVDIDLTGRIGRRKGYELKRADAAHSLWSNGDQAFYVSGGSLYQLNSDFSRTGLRSEILPDARVSFCAVGSEVYYTNGFQTGKIIDGVSWPWVGESYSGPETMWRIVTYPPVGHLLETIGGYMLVAEGNVLWVSMQFAPSWYRPSRDRFEFDSRITMVKALNDGVWVSDERNIYWLAGPNPAQWQRVKKDVYPAIPGTVAEVDAGLVKGTGQILPDRCAIWAGTNGICIGAAQGYFANLTQPKLRYPKAARGSGIVVDDKYVCTLEAHHLGMALNLQLNAATQYMNFRFNSTCTFQGMTLAAGDGGIFLLETGESDQGSPIQAWFKTVTTDLGAENHKRIRRMHLGYEANGDLSLTVIADEKRQREHRLSSAKRDQTQQGSSVPGARDVYGRYLAFKIENVNGADFSVDHLSILPVVLQKHK